MHRCWTAEQKIINKLQNARLAVDALRFFVNTYIICIAVT